jgi:RimJ/RimL family protein N-acetyltransferase
MRIEPQALAGRFVRLEPFTPELEPEVRAALDVDEETWSIMSSSAMGPHFDGWWSTAMAEAAAGRRIPFAIRRLGDGKVVGTTSLSDFRPAHRSLHIGATFIHPEARSGPANPDSKRLLLARAFAAGAVRVEIIVDTRNRRSQAAVLKLGAKPEGVLRKHKITWTGFVRDTAIFSIVDDEWPAVRAALEARLDAF